MSDPHAPMGPDFTKPPGDQAGPPPGQFGQNPGQPLPPYPGVPPHYTPEPMSPQNERTWGLLAHLSTIAASFVGLPFLGPMLVFLILKDRSRFVREHAAEALNMNIAVFAYSFVLSIVFTVIGIVTLGVGFLLFYLFVLLGIPVLVFVILAAVAASAGRPYRYPLIFRLVR